MPFLDEKAQPIDLSRRIDWPEGFRVTPADTGVSRAEKTVTACAVTAGAIILIVIIAKRKAILAFLGNISLNCAAFFVRLRRRTAKRVKDISDEVDRRANSAAD